jgi:tetratricopeptide (TPR) repeat protein
MTSFHLSTRLLVIAICCCCAGIVQAQSAKDYFKIAVNYAKENNHSEAVKRFTKAINLEPDYERAYSGRAESYEFLNQRDLAAEDWFSAGQLLIKKSEPYIKAAANFMATEQYDKCETALDKAAELDSKNAEIWQLKTRLYLQTRQIQKAYEGAKQAYDQKRTLINTYWVGVASDSIGNYDEAARYFAEIISGNHLYEDAYLGLIGVQLKRYYELSPGYMRTEELKKASENCAIALQLFPDNYSFYVLRSEIHFVQNDYSKAIDDISKAIARQPDRIDLLMTRGKYYQEFGQHHNAMNNYNAVLRLKPHNATALYMRGLAHEATFDHNAALSDFEEALRVCYANSCKRVAEFKSARDRILEMNRESEVPVIVLHHPVAGKNGLIRLPVDMDSLVVNGVVKDQSRIKYIKINGINASFNQKDNHPEFTLAMSLRGVNQLNISTSDWYDNTASVGYDILLTEVDPPSIEITTPYPTADNELTIEEGLTKLAIEGRVKDESLIKSIMINGIAASYAVDVLNPSFNAFIDVSNRNKISVSATDIFENEFVKEYNIVRQAKQIVSNNPMGKTWAVFIENTEYLDFPQIDGPAKDVAAMKSTLGRYEIDKVIHKKNLTKQQFERFFAIELRDLVRQNNVNSVLVWYAGHGQFLNDSGYWIPIDAQRDDEFTYFKVNNLKASLESYSKYLTHTLVVSDACESGPSFYEAMRSDGEDKRCDDVQATGFKSSQVLTSTGYELAVQKSVFTDAFSRTLDHNDNSCIAIDEVFQKINSEVRKSNQIARFGKITGLEDENGTFFFIRKE